MVFQSSTMIEEEACLESIQEAMAKRQHCALDREAHVKYLMDTLNNPLPAGYTSLDASRPWLFYWTVRSLQLLNVDISAAVRAGIIKDLSALQHADGGFCGNHGHGAHLAATFAACACLKILGAMQVVDRAKLRGFLWRLKQPDGAFMVQCEGGENDLRAVYCAVASAAISGLLDAADGDAGGLFDAAVVGRIGRCQTFEGGLGAVPFAEAHGGYTFCGLAALSLLSALDAVDVAKARAYVLRMQCPTTGGLRGRSNKLVDGCYSYWQGAAARILNADVAWDRLSGYILSACQARSGGLRDKPGKPADLYHTCYCLSGLAVCEDSIDPLLNC